MVHSAFFDWLLSIIGMAGVATPFGVVVDSVYVENPQWPQTQQLVAHEQVHTEQWQKYGVIFPMLYTVEFFIWGYDDMPLEKEARKVEINVSSNGSSGR